MKNNQLSSVDNADFYRVYKVHRFINDFFGKVEVYLTNRRKPSTHRLFSRRLSRFTPERRIRIHSSQESALPIVDNINGSDLSVLCAKRYLCY